MSTNDTGSGGAGARRTPRVVEGDDAPRIDIQPIDTSFSFKNKAYAALKNVIVSMDIYRSRSDIRLDERKLALDFGVSRTPVREAMAQLEREGFVRSVPRRGVYVVRKTKEEVIQLITAWAALESMAARLITQNAKDGDIASLRNMFATFEGGELRAHLDEYSDVNIEFHQTIIRMSEKCRSDRSGGKSVHAYADDPPQDHRGEESRRQIDPRSHEHHRGTGGAQQRPRSTPKARTWPAPPSGWHTSRSCARRSARWTAGR